MEKNKKKRKNRALVRPHPPGGAAARSENAIFLATAPPHPSYGTPARLARSRDDLGALRACTVRASTQWPWRVRALAVVALGRKSTTSVRSRVSDGASALCALHL
ncbi:hypothetical protein PIB30_062488 [Stylosanthes scabra]|uniref:Uncharacterized protein n=1 Tax=Stylosanthes scabra TaxID=79078 RepID=A0ABU6RLH9_9FABA|nr:hypothetical protein [Stylosanthes scabra]